MITDKNILCVSRESWEDTDEQQIMVEILAGANNIIWVNPYGGINANLLPRIYRLKETLTIYCPGINFLPLSFLEQFNQSRLLLQIKLYLMERDFEPDLVWIDNPASINFARAYRKRGASSLYFHSEKDKEALEQGARFKLTNDVDFIYRMKSTPSDLAEEEFMGLIYLRLGEISRQLSKI